MGRIRELTSAAEQTVMDYLRETAFDLINIPKAVSSAGPHSILDLRSSQRLADLTGLPLNPVSRKPHQPFNPTPSECQKLPSNITILESNRKSS